MVALALAGITAPALALALAQTPPPPPPAEARVQAAPYVIAAGQSDLYEINSSQIGAEID
jgi:putative membrane protein